MDMKGLKKILLMGCIFMVFLLIPTKADAKIMKTTDNVYFRSSGSLKGKIIGVLKTGTQVNYKSKKGSWTKVSYAGKAGFVSSKYLKTVSTAPKKVYATVNDLNVRKGRGSKYPSFGRVNRGYAFTRIKTYGDWTKVKTVTGLIGYVYTSYISTTNPIKVSLTASQAQMQNIRLRAESYCRSRLGNIYSQPNRDKPGYADCSSLQRDAFRYAAGVYIGDNTTDQYKHMKNYFYKINSVHDAKPGDLVYRFGPTSNHVGLYLGNGYVIHASGTYKKVVITYFSATDKTFGYGCNVGKYCIDNN